jgi:hypothetical protein
MISAREFSTRNRTKDKIMVKPTPAQRRALLDAIEHGGQLNDRLGSPVRIDTIGALVERGWITRDTRTITEDGIKAVK